MSVSSHPGPRGGGGGGGRRALSEKRTVYQPINARSANNQHDNY